MAHALVRQWLILSLLPRPPRRIDARSLEEKLRERGLVIHRRTLQRDLVALSALFPIVADDRNKPFGWRWTGAERLPATDSMLDVELSLESGDAAELVAWLGGTPAIPLPPRAVGRVTVRVALADTEPSRRRLFAVAHLARVVAPSSLRAEIARRARAALAHEDP